MGISKSGCSKSITKEDLENSYKIGFVEGAKAVCSLILESLYAQRLEILDNRTENCDIALKTINESIKSVEDRLNNYNNHKVTN